MNKVLSFLRLVDPHDGQISLTNVALIVVLVKIGFAPEVSLVDAGALFVTLLSYQGKKLINRDAGVDAEAIERAQTMAGDSIELTGKLLTRVDELSSKVTQQQMTLGIKDIRK
jgi:hypothetical protein